MTRVLLVAAVVATAAWVAAPWVSMARHGTRDQQTVRAWRTEVPDRHRRC